MPERSVGFLLRTGALAFHVGEEKRIMRVSSRGGEETGEGGGSGPEREQVLDPTSPAEIARAPRVCVCVPANAVLPQSSSGHRAFDC